MPATDPALERVEALVDLRRYADAERELSAHLAEDPDSIPGLLTMALIQDNLDRPWDSAVTARRAIALAPDEERGFRLLANAQMSLGAHEASVHNSARAVELAPQRWATHYTQGLALLRAGQPGAALTCVNEAVRLNPHEAEAHNLAGVCLIRMRSVKEAHRAFEEAVRLDPQNTNALTSLAGISVFKGRLGKASTLVSAGLAGNPREESLRERYDEILRRLLVRLWWGLAAVLIIVLIEFCSGAEWWARAATAVIGYTSCGVAIRWLMGRLPRGSWQWARGLFGRANPSQRAVIVLPVIAAATILLLSVVPMPSPATRAAVGSGFSGVSLFAVICWRVSRIAARLDRRRQ